MPFFAIPGILNRRARSEVLDSVVQSVSVLVIYDLSPCWYHVVQVRHNLMQRNAKARDIAILVHMPARPRQLKPSLFIQYEFVGFSIGITLIVQRLYNCNAIDDVELVLNSRFLYLLVIVAKSSNECICQIKLLNLLIRLRLLFCHSISQSPIQCLW